MKEKRVVVKNSYEKRVVKQRAEKKCVFKNQ